ncbi:MAG: DUF2207 domain-containing protein [Cyanobacteria bacterium P01_H01_bin.152]
MTTLKRVGWRLGMAVLVCLLCLGMGIAQAATPFFWDFMNVDITLEANGDLLVKETQKYVFTSNHSNERYRYIPLKGINEITDVAVYENNEPLSVDTGQQNNQYWIRWQHPLNPPAAHTFVVQYRVVGGIQVKDNRAQLYWNAIFPQRSAPINRGTVTVHVPEALVGKVDRFRGEGVTSRDRKLNATTFEFATKGALEPQQALNIRLEFPADALTIAQAQTDYWVKKTSPLAPLLSWAGPGGIVALILSVIVAGRKRCPNCGKLTLKRSSRVVKPATRYSQGKRNVRHTCQSCNYDRRFNRTIPRQSSSSSSVGGVWGGCDGGSSGGSDFGGGGGFGGGGSDCGGGGG